MPDYSMYRLKKADKNTIVRAGVGVIVAEPGGRILLEKRSDCGLWGLPGGRIEPGESVKQAAVREIKEETGLNIRITGMLGVYSESRNRLVVYPERVVQLVDVILTAVITGGRLACSCESEELRFFPPDRPPRNIVPPARRILADLRKGLSGVIR